jgi:hypothetical protein
MRSAPRRCCFADRYRGAEAAFSGPAKILSTSRRAPLFVRWALSQAIGSIVAPEGAVAKQAPSRHSASSAETNVTPGTVFHHQIARPIGVHDHHFGAGVEDLGALARDCARAKRAGSGFIKEQRRAGRGVGIADHQHPRAGHNAIDANHVHG